MRRNAAPDREGRLTVAVFSESVFTVKGHGVHTAYCDTLRLLDRLPGVATSTRRVWRSADIVHVHTMGPLALLLLTLHQGGRVLTAHITPESFVGSITCADRFIRPITRYLTFVYNRADLVIAVSESVVSRLLTMGVRTPICVIPNSIDAQSLMLLRQRRSEFRRRFGWGPEHVVVAVGQLQPRKGVDIFLQCANRMADTRFVWVGDMIFGPLAADRRRLKRLRASSPDNVQFTGLVSRMHALEFCAAADVFFLPSRQETFGLSVLEAAAVGLPLLLSSLTSNNQLFGQDYIRASKGDYVSALRKLLSDETLREHYQRASWSLAQKYDARRYESDLAAVYRRAAECGASRRGRLIRWRQRRERQVTPSTDL